MSTYEIYRLVVCALFGWVLAALFILNSLPEK